MDQKRTATDVSTGSECDSNSGTNDSLSLQQGLKVLISGAGIGGLTAAIALRQQGHDVHVFESSKLASEIGAAIFVPPNANGALRELGVRVEEAGANVVNYMTSFFPDGSKKSIDVRKAADNWPHEWYMAHRQSLHRQLKEKALDSNGEGTRVTLHVSSQVVLVDPHSASITLSNGSRVEGDVVIGADGVHSKSRKFIPGGNVTPFSSGRSAFRFMLEKRRALEDPDTAKFEFKDGEFLIWSSTDTRIVIYPTAHNTLLNFVCIHPETESEATEDWGQTGKVESLIKVFSGSEPAVKRLLGKANPKTLKVWKLLDMEGLEDWTHERLALIGDAAHPFLPYQGQGGAQAIEDAISIAVMLGVDTKKQDIPARLKLYQQARKERAYTIQEYTRRAWSDPPNNGTPFDRMKIRDYCFNHDELGHSKELLRNCLQPKLNS
ncbi:MAG: hypothetical protein Q9160_001579 [Pyrenula sp. 1 TL-2023]